MRVQVGLFTDAIPAEMAYIISHSDATFVLAKDQEQCDKMLDIRDQIPAVRRVIYWHGGRALIDRTESLGGARFSLIWPRKQG